MSYQRYSVLLVSSSGGVLLDLLALEPWWSRHRPVWVAVPGPDTEEALEGQKVHWVREPSLKQPSTVLEVIFQAWRILRRDSPDIVVSAGTRVAVCFFVMAKMLRIPSLWLSSLNLIATPGMAGRVCSRLASVVLLQQESMRKVHPNGIVIGQLY